MADRLKLKACPKCGGVQILWTETSLCSQVFIQDETGIDPDGAKGDGEILRVEGACAACEHRWTPRSPAGSGRTFMVTQLPGHPDYSGPA